LQAAQVIKCENSLIGIILAGARCACELAGEPNPPLLSTAANSPAEV
jgi:hypothetical protein